MAYLALSRRAALDLIDIDLFSTQKWGATIAQQYLMSFEEALSRLREDPRLLRTNPQLSTHFGLYRIRKHFLIGIVAEENVYILAVKHGAVDLPTQLLELEPTLLREAELLHHKYLRSIQGS